MRNSPLAFVVAAIALAACSEPPVPPPVVTLAPTPDTIIVKVVGISHAVPLSGNRWAVLGLEEGSIQILDFNVHTVKAFPGITKAEVAKPSIIFGLADTVAVSDWGLARVTRWTPGSPRLEAVPIPEVLRGALPRATDAAGNWYFQITPPRGPHPERDSAAIVRGDPLLTHFDTLAKLAPPEMAAVEDGYGRAMLPVALGGEDRWGVLPDGRLWIARTFQNRVTWYWPDGRKPVLGKKLPDPVLTVQPMDKEIYIRRYPEDQRENARMATPWSAIKPPFERVFSDVDGVSWLFKTAPALDSVRTFQVADTNGVREMVQVPSRGMALSVTPEAILMAEEFPGGIRVLRYQRPK